MTGKEREAFGAMERACQEIADFLAIRNYETLVAHCVKRGVKVGFAEAQAFVSPMIAAALALAAAEKGGADGK